MKIGSDITGMLTNENNYGSPLQVNLLMKNRSNITGMLILTKIWLKITGMLTDEDMAQDYRYAC